jgi:hypothetical protein
VTPRALGTLGGARRGCWALRQGWGQSSTSEQQNSELRTPSLWFLDPSPQICPRDEGSSALSGSPPRGKAGGGVPVAGCPTLGSPGPRTRAPALLEAGRSLPWG